MPHHMLQLQAIVDSLTLWRGWDGKALRDDIADPLVTPAQDFLPRRDLDRFLDRKNINPYLGFLEASNELARKLRAGTETSDRSRYLDSATIIERQAENFRHWLSESNYASDLPSIPRSRFSASNPNRLWEYSPFLCGVGLLEGLEIAYRFGISLWNHIPEPVLAFHLFNMLVQVGYITERVELYEDLTRLFENAFFHKRVLPTSNFADALSKVTEMLILRHKIDHSASEDIHATVEPTQNRFSVPASNLILFRVGNWDKDCVSEDKMRVPSALGIMHLCRTKQFVDEETDERHFDRTVLVNRFLGARQGNGTGYLSEDDLLERVDGWKALSRERKAVGSNNDLGNPPNASQSPCPNQVTDGSESLVLDTVNFLQGTQVDAHDEIAGRVPLLDLNYASVTLHFLKLFDRIEEELKKRKNPLYLRVFDGPQTRTPPRVKLVTNALLRVDDDCLRVMAKEIQELGGKFNDFLYWPRS